MKKYNRNNILKFIAIYVPVVVLILGIGYASVSYDLSVSGSVAMTTQDDIAIINVTPTTYIENYNKTVLTTSLELSNSSDSKTMSVSIKNLGNSKQIFDGIVYDPSQSLIYSNSNIVPSVSGITENSSVVNSNGNNDDNITFNLTFAYQNPSNTSNNGLDGTISFHFTPLREITYVNCTNSNSLSSEYIRSKSFTNMSNVTYTPTVTIANAPANIVITDASNNTLASGTNYTYSNGVVTFLTELTSNLTIAAVGGGNGGTWDAPVRDTTTTTYNPADVPIGTTLYEGISGQPQITKDYSGNITRFKYTNTGTNGVSTSTPINTGVLAFDGNDFTVTLEAKLPYSTKTLNPILVLSQRVGSTVEGVVLFNHYSNRYYTTLTGTITGSSAAKVNGFRIQAYSGGSLTNPHSLIYPNNGANESNRYYVGFTSSETPTVKIVLTSINNQIDVKVYNTSNNVIGQLYNNYKYTITGLQSSGITVELGHWENNSGTSYNYTFNVINLDVVKN